MPAVALTLHLEKRRLVGIVAELRHGQSLERPTGGNHVADDGHVARGAARGEVGERHHQSAEQYLGNQKNGDADVDAHHGVEPLREQQTGETGQEGRHKEHQPPHAERARKAHNPRARQHEEPRLHGAHHDRIAHLAPDVGAVGQAQEFLAFEQTLVADDFLGSLVAVFQHLGNFPVNLGSDFFAVFTALAKFHTDKYFLIAPEINGSDFLAHAELCNHFPAKFRCSFQVTGRTGIDFSESNLFSRMSAEQHGNLVHQLASADIIVFLGGKCERMSGSLSTGYDGDKMDFIASGKHMSDDGMSAFMVSNHPAVVFIDFMAFLFRSHLDTGDCVNQQLLVDLCFPGSGGKNGSLIHDIFQVSTSCVRHSFCNIVQIDIRVQCLSFAVDFQNGNTSVLIRIIDGYLTVKPSGTQKGGVQYIPSVGGGHDNYTLIYRKAVHLNQQLIQCLLAFIMSAAEAGTAVTADSVDLINKHNGRRDFFCLFKKVADPACTDTDKHFNKITAADGEERNSGFTCNSFGKQCFPCTWRADKQDALWNSGAGFNIIFGVFQEIHHFLKFFLFFICSGNIRECNLVFGWILQPCMTSSKGHHTTVSASLSPHHHIPDNHQDAEHDNIGQELIPPRNCDRRAVLYLERQLVYSNLFNTDSLPVRFHLPDR